MTACITGATAGIGLAFTEELAAEGSDLVVVARDTGRLQALANRLAAEHGISVEVLTADLATEAGCTAVMERLADASLPVDVLVNNAGFGVNQGFVGGSLAEEERLLDVLVRATLRLTHAALPGMVQRGRGTVINVSSVAGFVPMGTYSAAKAWVTVFTEGLGPELSETGVTATAVCPGFTHTEFHERAEMDMVFLPEWAWLDSRRVARDGLREARAGHAVSVPSKRYTSLALAAQYMPRPILRRAGTRIAQSRAARR
jgi:short-subunit dehydrogenase